MFSSSVLLPIYSPSYPTILFLSPLILSHLPLLLLILLPPSSSLLSHPFYTCRYLHILIYILLLLPKYSTPHKLSEWMVEV
jgi:hypothetical protein